MTPVLAIVAQAAQRPSMLPFVIQLIAIVAIFYFLLIRPQRAMARKHQETLAALKKGDEIVTTGGIVGTILHLADDRITIRTAENTRLVIVRAKIERVLSGEKAGEAQP